MSFLLLNQHEIIPRLGDGYDSPNTIFFVFFYINLRLSHVMVYFCLSRLNLCSRFPIHLKISLHPISRLRSQSISFMHKTPCAFSHIIIASKTHRRLHACTLNRFHGNILVDLQTLLISEFTNNSLISFHRLIPKDSAVQNGETGKPVTDAKSKKQNTCWQNTSIGRDVICVHSPLPIIA